MIKKALLKVSTCLHVGTVPSIYKRVPTEVLLWYDETKRKVPVEQKNIYLF